MNLYFAPMEGITGAIFRRTANRHFPYVDKYYAPFIQPNRKHVFAPKEKRDILPEYNDGVPVVPQILTCAADGFIRAGRELETYGYREINLNLGCPSGTVVSKGKGAGMLASIGTLDAFLDAIFQQEWKADITVKTRLGMTQEDDFQELLEVFRKYPIHELTIHPRYRSDFYKGEPRMEAFSQALDIYADSATGLCFNGNIFTKQDYDTLQQQYGASAVRSVMIGRGLLANPALARELRGGEALTKEELYAFHNDLFAEYQALELGERNTLFKMKELWNYWGTIFADAQHELKKIRKAERYAEYLPAVDALFRNAEFTESHGYVP